MSRHGAIWVSTSTSTRGGVASYVRAMRETPLWDRWSVRHVATHQDGSVLQRLVRFARGAVAFWFWLAVDKPAVVHLHSASRGSFARKSLLLWSARLRGVPVVVHVHGGGFADFHAGLPGVLRRYVTRTLEAADVVIALGPSWADKLRLIAPGARVVVVPNAVSPRPRGERPATGESTVLFLGRLCDDKGVHTLVQAWAQVLAALPGDADARLVLAGDGEVERFRSEVDGRGLARSVDIPGWVSPAGVEELLQRADVLVLPSRWEGHPMSVLEAMARGIPVVATAVGGVPDLVDERSGILVAPDDVEALMQALSRVLTDAALRTHLGEGGLRRVRQELDLDLTWRRLDALYSELAR